MNCVYDVLFFRIFFQNEILCFLYFVKGDERSNDVQNIVLFSRTHKLFNSLNIDTGKLILFNETTGTWKVFVKQLLKKFDRMTETDGGSYELEFEGGEGKFAVTFEIIIQ